MPAMWLRGCRRRKINASIRRSDGLRGVAVLMVFYEHYLGVLSPAFRWGWTGVSIFFVLSGFLITGILYDTQDMVHRFRNFYVRRTLRIFPLYYGLLLVLFLSTPIFHWVWHPVWLLWPLYLFNYGRFIWVDQLAGSRDLLDDLWVGPQLHSDFHFFLGHLWSLSVEEQFYLVWPFLVFFVRDRVRLRNLCFAFGGLALLGRILGTQLLPHKYLIAGILYNLTPLRADSLLIGAALALMLRGPEAAFLTRWLRPAFWTYVAGFLACEGLYRLFAHHFYYANAYYSPELDTIGYPLIDIFSAIVILLSLQQGGRLYRILTVRWLRRVGTVSYGFYLFHDIPHIAYILLSTRLLGRFADVPMRVTLTTAVVGLAGTLTLSFLSFRYFESPFLRLKDRFTR